MKKIIKPKISIFCFGSLLLVTPVLLATSCSSKTENKIDNKQTPIIKKPESAKPVEKVSPDTSKPSTPTVTPTKPPILVTPVKTELTRAKVVELGWNRVASVTKEMFKDKIPGITHIGQSAFFQNYSLTSLEIPDSVVSIGDLAFANCRLTSLDIPDSLISIGQNAFVYNKLTSLDIPNSVVSIGENAFFHNPIAKLKIGNGTKSIGRKAFYNCPIKVLDLGTSLETIGQQAFDGNIVPANTLIIPNSVTSIDREAFISNTGYPKVLQLPAKFNTTEGKSWIGVS